MSMMWRAISAWPYPEDEGWLCPLCDARVESFYGVNQDFDLELDASTASWTEVFPEAWLDRYTICVLCHS